MVEIIEDQVRRGYDNAMLVSWVSESNLLGDTGPTPDASIQSVKEGLAKLGWKWNTVTRQMERDGWRVWFRSQGLLSPPIAQWSRLSA